MLMLFIANGLLLSLWLYFLDYWRIFPVENFGFSDGMLLGMFVSEDYVNVPIACKDPIACEDYALLSSLSNLN